VALVEVKTGRNTLNPEQLNSYIEVARSEGFDSDQLREGSLGGNSHRAAILLGCL